MKHLGILILLTISISCKSQIYPLRTFTPIPENAYLKDTNNEFNDYEGTWKGQWNNKIIYLKLNKITNKYFSSINEYRDLLVGRFKTTDLNGNILFDNTVISNEDVKIYGTYFRHTDDKYQLFYNDIDMCNRSGDILINFTDITKNQLKWHYAQGENFIDSDCFYFGWPQANIPQPLPEDIILTKQ